VLLAQGSAAGGFTFYVKDRRLHYTHNWVGRELQQLTSDAEVSGGRHTLRYEFEPHGQHKAPYRFTGTLHTVTVDLSGELIRDPEAELKLHMARQ
jgi:hypothetical protein